MDPLQIVFLAVLFLYSCGYRSAAQERSEVAEPCSFANPVARGQDPWVVKKDNRYYFIESKEGGLYVSKTDRLTDLKGDQKRVWSLPDTGWNRENLGAPELHFLNGKWYIYYAAGESGPPFIHQRSGVLESVTDDPVGEYIDKGMLYTGDEIKSGENNKWSIDLTVFKKDGQLYAIWSGWEENADTDRTAQHLYIAEMENPWTIGSNRVRISSPDRLKIGRAGIYRSSADVSLIYEFDTLQIPYLGIWLCYGGWPEGTEEQQYTIAIESVSGRPDALDEAIKRKEASTIRPGEIKEWTLEIDCVEGLANI